MLCCVVGCRASAYVMLLPQGANAVLRCCPGWRSGAEIEGLVKSATSFALNRQVDVTDLTKPIDEESIKVMHSLKAARPWLRTLL